MSYRSNSSSFSQHGDQDKRKKGIFSKVFGSSGAGSGSSRPYDDVPSAYSSQRVQPSSVTSSSTRSEAPSQYSVTDAPHQPERLLEPRRSFTVQAAMQEVAQPDAMSQPVYTDSNQAISTGGSSVSTAPVTSVNVGLPPLPPAMSAWRQAQELTRKAEEEAMLAEKKSQEAYVCATEAAAAQKEAEDAHEQYDRSKGQLRILEEEQLRAEEAKEQVEQSLQALSSREAEMAQLQTDAEKAAEVARAKYDEARAQRELAEQRTAEHKQLETEHSAIQQRLHDADAQLASMSGDVEQQVSALDEVHASCEQQTGRLREAEEEVERIERQLAQAQEVVAQLKQDVDAITREEEEQQASVDAKLEQQRMQASFLETTKLQLTDLQQRGDAASTEAQQCQAAIRGKADVAKQERENALACKAAVDTALSEMEAQREAHVQKERDLHIQQQASAQAADQIPSIREEAEFRAKQTNQKYDEAEQKSQAWMKAKDEAQSHKRMWHSYWQQAMHVGSDADVEANTKLKGLEEKLAAVGQNISLRVKVKENDMEDEEDEEALDGKEGQTLQQHRLPQGNGELSTAVVLACRDEKRGEQLRVALEANAKEHGNSKPQAEVMLLDVSSLQSVRSFVQRWNQQHRPLHCLINNAGIFDIGGSQGYAKSKDGLELHMATNYLGPFLLTMLLLPSLQRSASKERPARIVNLTSKMADTCTLDTRDPHLRAPGAWSGARAYSQSKLCQIISTAEMRRRLVGDDRVFVCAVDPGLVITNVVRTTPGWIQYLYRVLLTTLLVTPKEGARSSVHCATSQHITEEKSPSQCYINFTCKPVRPKARFVDPASGKWLWQWSAETTGLPAEVDLPERPNGFA